MKLLKTAAVAALLAGLALPALAQQRTLTLNTDASDPAPKAAFDQLIAGFEAENPDVKVVVNIFDHEGYKTAIRNFLTADSPDLANWYDWRARADILRLESADPAVIAEIQLAEDGAQFVVFAGQSETSAQILPRPLRLTGLDPQARYRLNLRNRVQAPDLSRGEPALKTGPLELSGQALMGQGVNLPWGFAQTMWVIEGERL